MTPEQEIKLLKELLCTKRSCNNCGKVNCENFQRQRIDCCGLWVSYKDYITELENKIADIKANCDLAIEGRDIKIKELELELTVEKDQHQEEIELHLHAEEYIKSLEQQIEKLIDFVLSKTECCDVCPETDTCINSEGTCPYAGILAKKGEKEVTREWLMQFISRR